MDRRKMPVSRQWIDRVSWNDNAAFINLFRATIEQSPEYTDECC
jgi:hypothetical protein